MRTEYHAFVDGDVGHCGAIPRHVESGRLRTRTVFRMGDDAPLYVVDHVVEHDGDVRRWHGFTYDCPTTSTRHVGTRAADGTVHVDGVPTAHLSGAVGGYGEHLVLAQLRREGDEATALLDGSTVVAERIRLTLDGAASNTHWSLDGVVVKSDWCGAQSFLVDDTGALCAGLDPEVVQQVEDFPAR